MSQLISAYGSRESNGGYKNLGGPPGEPLVDGTLLFTIFEHESVFGGELYQVLYMRNENYSSDVPITAFGLSIAIDFSPMFDISKEHYLQFIRAEIITPSYLKPNLVHPYITYDGYFVDTYPEHITDFLPKVQPNRKNVFITSTLNPGDFYPIILRVKIDGPVPTAFRVPMDLKIMVGV